MFLNFSCLFYCTLLLPLITLANFCDTYQPPESYRSLKRNVDEKIGIFSNKKNIASHADQTLSNLLAAKSPVVSGWLTKRNLNSKSEEEIVSAWRDYFARNFILTKYPHNDRSIDKEIVDLLESINRLFSDPKFRSKMDSLFKKSRESSLLAVKAMALNDEQKRKILGRIGAINLYWMKDFKTSKFKQLPMDFLDWGIAYDPVANEINIGINALAYPNEETFLAVFAHEIGHSFDSCRWSAFFDGDWPFQKIGDCLRKSNSVGAKKRDDSKLNEVLKNNSGLAASLRANPTCNKLAYPLIGLQADQLPESFADWFSAEVMAIAKDINPAFLRLDLCEKKELNPGSSYPTNELRLEAIYFTHPKFKDFRNNLKSNTYQYCGLEPELK